MCHTKIDDVTVYVTFVTSELLLSSCVVAQSTGSTISHFHRFDGYIIIPKSNFVYKTLIINCAVIKHYLLSIKVYDD